MAKGVADPIPTQSGNSGKFLKTLFMTWLYFFNVKPSDKLYLLSSFIIFKLLVVLVVASSNSVFRFLCILSPYITPIKSSLDLCISLQSL